MSVRGPSWTWRTRVQARWRLQIPAALRPLILAAGVRPGVLVQVSLKPVDGWSSTSWVTRMPFGWRLTVPEAYREEDLKPGNLVEVSLKPLPKPPKVELLHYGEAMREVREAVEELHKALRKEPSKAVRIHGSGMIIRL